MTLQLAGLVIDGPPYTCANTVVTFRRAGLEVAVAALRDATRLGSTPAEVAA
jgi:hypothetical protein